MAKTEKQTRRTTGTKKLSGDVAKAVEAALDKKASEIVVLDLRQTPAFTDFFVLCSGQNQPSPGSKDCTSACPVMRKCAVACWPGDESQQPI